MDVSLSADKHKSTFNPNLEILRGIAALIVVLSHIIVYNRFFDSSYFPPVNFKSILLPGKFSVLIFFVLSGYVIGLNHRERLQGHNIILYLRKRFLRIYPIYFLATLLALVVATTHYNFAAILSNFTLTQNIAFPVFWENNPAWSLNYEALFYLLFIPISFFPVRSGVAFMVMLIVGIANIYSPINPILTAYSFGFCFWIAGLYIAKDIEDIPSEIKIIPLLFYILAIGIMLGEKDYLAKLFSLIKPIPAQHGLFWSQEIIGLNDLLLLPYAFIIILIFAGKFPKQAKAVFIGLQVLPLYIIISFYKKHIQNGDFLLGEICYLIALITYFIPMPQASLKRIGVWFGSISYGIYIIHFPLLILFGRMVFFPDNFWCYLIKVLLYLLTVVGISFLLERKLQPVVRGWFRKPSTTRS